MVTIDFESYSAAGFYTEPDGRIRGSGHGGRGGLPVVGTPVYAAHPSTEILCLSYDMSDGAGVQDWIPGMPQPRQLLLHVAAGGAIEAHNVTFEYHIWNQVGVRLYGWPELRIEQLRCSAAKSRRYSLPGALAKVAKVLGTALKDPEGGRLIQKLTRPHTPTLNRSADRWTIATAWDDYLKLFKYCNQDVVAEKAISARIPDLSEHEQAIHQADLRVNDRGLQVDTTSLDACLWILKRVEFKYNAELGALTGGMVKAATELARLQVWLEKYHGVIMPNMQKATIDETVEAGGLPAPALRALRIRQLLGSANIKKLHTLKLQTSDDGRLRDQYIYCGADRTGRWCIAENEPVLVRHLDGTVSELPIQAVTREMRLWDGLEWVEHGGVVDSGVQDVISHDGVTGTGTHRVFTSATEYETLLSVKQRNGRIFRGESKCPSVSIS